MNQMTIEQIRIWAACLLFGAAAGLWYDVFRAVRLMGKKDDRGRGGEDILYVVTVMSAFFFLVQRLSRGLIRFYMLVGAAAGLVLYELFLHPLFFRIIKGIIYLLSVLGGFFRSCLLRPIEKIMKYFVKILKKAGRTVRMIRKKI